MVLEPQGDGTYAAQRREVLHRQRQRGRDGLDLRQAHRRPTTTSSSPPTPSTSATSSSRTSCASQNYVSEFRLDDYPITEADILHRQATDAWDAALNTVNIGKYNLGWASIGICTHALYEAITHATQPPPLRHARSPTSRTCGRCSPSLRAARRDEALRAARRDYMRTASRRRPPLPALQPDGEDEGDAPRARTSSTCCGT